MTNLKGLPAHESRECFHANPVVLNPLLERWLTICFFIVGAVFYSSIYGNIQHHVAAAQAVGHRYSIRIGEIK
jgi:hypothetical protein